MKDTRSYVAYLQVKAELAEYCLNRAKDAMELADKYATQAAEDPDNNYYTELYLSQTKKHEAWNKILAEL